MSRKGMTTDGTPARKSRRIVDEDEDDDEELPDIRNPAFMTYQKPTTPQPAEEKADQESDDEGLFSADDDDDDDEGSDKDEKRSPNKKRYSRV
jgi:hypothetical protein